jgi:hypothetical protein
MRQLPSADEIARIHRDILLNRAIEAYKFFYPTVSMALNFEALAEYGAAANRGFLIQLTTPDIVTLTQNSDTTYGLGMGDMTDAGPIVVDIPPGPVMGVVDDMNFQFVTNMGLVGEEAGAGAKYLFVPPGYDQPLPSRGYLIKHVPTNRFLVCARAPFPDPEQGKSLLRTLKIYPLSEASAPPANSFTDMSNRKAVANPCVVDGTFDYWNVVKRALDMDIPSKNLYNAYGMLADLGLRTDRPFQPDEDLTTILTEAAQRADEQLVVTAFANQSPERLVWTDRRWEWVAYSKGNFGYYERDFLHLTVRERWFYQATLETDKMFMHQEGAGSIYWLANRDSDGTPLDGGTNYTLRIPAPVPAGQFWSVTLYDLDTRSEINTRQFKPVLTSLRDNLSPGPDGQIALHFGPGQPEAPTAWLQTNPGRQWFAYFRIYGPTAAAFNGDWKPSDFQRR